MKKVGHCAAMAVILVMATSVLGVAGEEVS